MMSLDKFILPCYRVYILWVCKKV